MWLQEREEPEWEELIQAIDRLEGKHQFDGMMADTAREFAHRRSKALLVAYRTHRNSQQLAQKLQETCKEHLCEFSFTASPLKTP